MPKKRDQAKIDAQVKDLTGLVEEIKTHSDRAAAIVGAAFIDERLRQYLSRFLIDKPKEVEELFGFDRPLGSFGSRIRTAYCLGLLDDDEYHDLKIIQEVRNAFAHELHGLTFADPWVANKCKDLVLITRGTDPSLYANDAPRNIFLHTVADLVASMATEQFHLYADNARRVVPAPRHWRAGNRKRAADSAG